MCACVHVFVYVEPAQVPDSQDISHLLPLAIVHKSKCQASVEICLLVVNVGWKRGGSVSAALRDYPPALTRPGPGL